MNDEILIQHVALQYNDEDKADIFFSKILGLKIVKSSLLDKQLSKQIFGINDEAKMKVYSNDKSTFEIFITKTKNVPRYDHVCIEIDNNEDFVNRCKKYNIEPIYVKKGEKTLLFIRDYAKNLYELKEKR
jgi:extradiol dioxygenase family protein